MMSICIAASLFAQPYEGQKGDVNNDGSINVLDVIRTVRSILGLDSPDAEEIWRADCNSFGVDCGGDGEVDILDVAEIVNLILRVAQCSNTTVTDIDGNVYYTVRIGTQEWMAENLKVTHYRNGDPIPNITDKTEWQNLSSGAYCSYNNDANYVATYGRLYNWYAVDDGRDIAPAGWHIPTDEEWKQLEICLGMSQSEADGFAWCGTDEGGKMKATGTIEAGTGLWNNTNAGATNSSGFSGLPAGYRSYYGSFYPLGGYAFFWSSTDYKSYLALYRSLYYSYAQVDRYLSGKENGFSVRCLRN